jgi:hypothetical protein
MEKDEGDGEAPDAHFGSIAILKEEGQPSCQRQACREGRDDSRPLPEFEPAAQLAPPCCAGKPDVEGKYWEDEEQADHAVLKVQVVGLAA